MIELNTVHIAGTIANDPRLDTARDGREFSAIKLQVPRTKGIDQTTDTVRVLAEGLVAKHVVNYMRKGREVVVTGKLVVNGYKDGDTGKLETEIRAERIQPL